MARTKVHPGVEAATKTKTAKGPSRKTQRQSKVKVEESDDSDMNGGHEDINAADSSASPQAEGTSKSARETKITKFLSGTPENASPASTPQAEQPTKRKGGNKRKWSHEYCLTCANYGRACGGRREGIEGCAVCREPNREKGEKLRECLWADPDNGIFTYKEAREALKKAQAEAKQKRGKPARARPQAARHSSPTAYSPADYMIAPDPLGIVGHPQSFDGPTAPIRKSYDLLPPGLIRAPSTVDRSSYRPPHDVQPQVVGETGPRIHHAQVISLDGEQPEAGSGTQSARRQGRRLLDTAPAVPPGGKWAPIHAEYFQFYDPKINAYVVPAFPTSNLPPPPQYGTPDPNRYISPYDAHASIPIALSRSGPPRPIIFQNRMNPEDAQPVFRGPTYSNPQPLDKSGKLSRRWSKSNSKITSLGGYEWHTKGWKADVNGDPKDTVSDGTRPNGIAVSTETASHKSADSSELSSAIDVDETMLEVTPTREKGTAHSTTPTPSPIQPNGHHSLSNSISDSEGDQNLEAQDRAQELITEIFRQNAKRKRNTIAERSGSRPAPIVAFNEKHEDFDDENATEDEGEKKRVPIKLRFSMSKASTTVPAPKPPSEDSDTIVVATKVRSALSARGRRSGSSGAESLYEDAAEDQIRVNHVKGWGEDVEMSGA